MAEKDSVYYSNVKFMINRAKDLNESLAVLETFKDDVILIMAGKDECSTKWPKIELPPFLRDNIVVVPEYREGYSLIADPFCDYYRCMSRKEVEMVYTIPDTKTNLVSRSCGFVDMKNRGYSEIAVGDFQFRSDRRGMFVAVLFRTGELVDVFNVDTCEDGKLAIVR
ncbi:MAG: hypothetical protein MJZ68_05590 [archaeon]|nr:hypothetical protein [archaeon]